MRLEDYIALLREDNSSVAHIELDRTKELQYMLDQQFRFLRVFEAIPNTSQSLRVLDIGTTPFTFFIKKAYPHYHVTGLDRTDLLCNRCQALGVQHKSCNLDDGSIPFDDATFDVVVFTEVLEHIFAPPRQILDEIRRVLEPGGKLILGVPNIATLGKRIRFLFGVTPLDDPNDQMKKDWVHGHGHIHEYTMKEIADIVKGCDFAVACTAYLQPDLKSLLRRLPKRGLRAVLPVMSHTLRSVLPSSKPFLLLQCIALPHSND